ncbi:MAG TPA: branched-chain amino acid ABC transporter substrate-binding protein [Firmicutes bacterium]|nr:branched-chain amino acid ABC transporter substrate-binding protein [Bacillota bacterium]
MMVLFCAALVSMCGIAAAASETEIRIGVYEPMTGAMAAGGQMTMEGIQLAQEQRPKVLGLPVRVILVDNRSDKVEAATAVTRLIQKDKVCAIIGSYGSALSMSGGPVAQAAKVPVMGCSPTNPLVTLGNDYYFRACFIDPFQGRVMAQFAYDKLGARKAAIIQDIAQDYAVGLANFFRQAFNELTEDPKSIIAFTSYQTGDRDYTAQLTYVANAKPDVVFAPGYYADAAVLVTQARSLGLKMPFLGGDTFEAPEFIEIGGKNVEGVYFSTHYSADAPVTPASERFVALYKARFKTAPNTFAALGYDCYNLVLDAIERAGSSNPKAIRDAMAETKDFVGATGIITLDANGDATKSAVVLVVKDGQFKLVDVVHPR